MNYTAELKKFATSHYIYSGIRISLAVVIPCIILAYLGLLKEYFLFPLGTVFLALTDSPGPFYRRRNALISALIFYFFVAIVAGSLKEYPFFIFLEIIIFGIFFTMLGIYGQRLSTVGSLTLLVFAIFIDGAPGSHSVMMNAIIFCLGAAWFLAVFMFVTVIKPYKLAQQMIGANYIELGNYLRIKSLFYLKNPDFDEIYNQMIEAQVRIKEQQETTREIVFKTRQIVQESTSYSRLLMQLFLNCLDLHEMLLITTNDYRKLQGYFGEKEIMSKINIYMSKLSNELINIGISIQGGMKSHQIMNIKEELNNLHDSYFELRIKELNAENLEYFMIMRQILLRITEITEEVQTIYKLKDQNIQLAKSLSTGLDLQKFLPKEEKLNSKVFFNNFTLKSNQFRHAIRLTLSMILGYAISKIDLFQIHKSYWVLITIIVIMRPAFSVTKHRNIMRIYGTVLGAIASLLIINYISNPIALFVIFTCSLLLTFSFLKDKYDWAVFFMTIYIFLAFNFMKPGNPLEIFKERLIDTVVACGIVLSVSYLILPVWEHQKNKDVILKYLIANEKYFNTIMAMMKEKIEIQKYKISRKNAIVTLANLSDNFSKMLLDPKNQQKNLEELHQFATTSHLFTAYLATLSQYAQKGEDYHEIDFTVWSGKINAELTRTLSYLSQKDINKDEISELSKMNPDDTVNELLQKRKEEISENEIYDRRDLKRISKLTELKNITELLELLYNEARELRKIARKLTN